MNLWHNLERRFAEVIGSTAIPNTPAQPEHSTDSTGVQIGNADIAEPAKWTPWTGPQERAPLPVYPQRFFRNADPALVRAACDARLAEFDAESAEIRAELAGYVANAQAAVRPNSLRTRMEDQA